ncbi:DUF255 domain-containing protein [Sulfurimonas aquatica]|uniref:DUF255 domain-containing protein n=1 Tax=Sulfurimonas aquatica TaxID=2672570 RepID=A0A975B1I9_9BACT|nr:thioredoxin family protein [Sulfurimonas aquatica]QSZ42430.1 DUF255 domain-containing protein [Sulfurimonas aquatica]
MHKLIISFLLLLVTTLVASESTVKINWAKDFDSGISQAKKENKPVLFVYSRHSCKYCVILEETTFSNIDVINSLNKDFVSIIAYSDENDAMPRELWRPGTPTMWFLKSDGNPMYQPLMGAMDETNFLKALEIVKMDFNKIKKSGK